MRKRYTILLILLGIIIVLAFMGFAIWQRKDSTPTFSDGGYILQSHNEQLRTLSFRQGDAYTMSLTGQLSFTSTEEGRVQIAQEQFAHLDSGSVQAFSDGVLLDLNDLSENFINNYYVPAGLEITPSEKEYVADTTAGEIKFGEHVWKLTDSSYLIRAASLKLYLSAGKTHDLGEFAQVYITSDSVAHILSNEGIWMTISPDCYIRTAKGVKIYPLALLVDNGRYKMSMAKLAVNADDAIVLTQAELRRQVVPEFKIEAVDGEDGADGSSGQSGSAGNNGSAGAAGAKGVNGA